MTFTLAQQPLPVDITTHTDWLALWLPFFGTVLLFAASMITVWWTNKAASKRLTEELDRAGIRHKSEMNALERRSKAEIEATRERDSKSWRRDQLLRVGLEVVEESYSARAELGRIAMYLKRPISRADLQPILDSGHRIAGNADAVQLLGEKWVAIRCRALADVVCDQDLWSAVGKVNLSLLKDAESPEAQQLI